MQNTVISLQNVTIQNENKVVLTDINFEVLSGDFVFLIGKTGSGKSSLLKVLYGDLNLSKGNGSIAGYDLEQLKDRDIPFLRRKLGVVFQDFKLLPDRTVFDNLAFVLKATGWDKVNSRREKIELCLSKVHIIELINKFPSQLSGGEKQKVAIARALLNDPEIIIADEPTGNLDPKSSLEIMEVLSEINSNGNTILMATHDFSLLKKYKGRILRCKDGLVDEIDSDNLEIEKIYS